MRKNIRRQCLRRELISFWNGGIGASPAAAAQCRSVQCRKKSARAALGTDTEELNAPSNFMCIRATQCFLLGLEQASRVRCFQLGGLNARARARPRGVESIVKRMSFPFRAKTQRTISVASSESKELERSKRRLAQSQWHICIFWLQLRRFLAEK